MLNYAESFGLILFVYALGLQVGRFFRFFSQGGYEYAGFSCSVVGNCHDDSFHIFARVSLSVMVGILSGAVTNTGSGSSPADFKATTDRKTDPALGCAVTYPGVVGVIIALVVIRKMFLDRTVPTPGEDMKSHTTFIVGFQVCNPGIFGKTIRETALLAYHKFVISRLWRDGRVSIPTSDTVLQEGDRLLVITSETEVGTLAMLFGEQEHVDWNKDDIDWNAIDSQLISQRILVTRSEINGKKLGSLRLRNHFGINITRIYRAGVELLATPELVLQLGDKLTVVGEANAIANVEKV
ncbi:MAG: TrkA C-terminal domain-containing protein, partial [Odoribacter splanchnicus]